MTSARESNKRGSESRAISRASTLSWLYFTGGVVPSQTSSVKTATSTSCSRGWWRAQAGAAKEVGGWSFRYPPLAGKSERHTKQDPIGAANASVLPPLNSDSIQLRHKGSAGVGVGAPEPTEIVTIARCFRLRHARKRMPELTVRAFAELLHLSIYEQSRILHEQKYPRQSPFRGPYYSVALGAIRKHYSGKPGALSGAARSCSSLKPASKGSHNLRVIQAFQGSGQAGRSLVLTPTSKMTTQLQGVDLKLRFDLCAMEAKKPWSLFYNCRDAALDPDVARTTLQLAAFVLGQATASPLPKLQFVDLKTGQVFSGKAPTARTIKLATANAKIIATLWPTI